MLYDYSYNNKLSICLFPSNHSKSIYYLNQIHLLSIRALDRSPPTALNCTDNLCKRTWGNSLKHATNSPSLFSNSLSLLSLPTLSVVVPPGKRWKNWMRRGLMLPHLYFLPSSAPLGCNCNSNSVYKWISFFRKAKCIPIWIARKGKENRRHIQMAVKI